MMPKSVKEGWEGYVVTMNMSLKLFLTIVQTKSLNQILNKIKKIHIDFSYYFGVIQTIIIIVYIILMTSL